MCVYAFVVGKERGKRGGGGPTPVGGAREREWRWPGKKKNNNESKDDGVHVLFEDDGVN